jgi:iron(III) transport system substrate-binding protein
MRKTRRIAAICIPFAVFALALSACSSSKSSAGSSSSAAGSASSSATDAATDSPAWQAIVAAAKKEGTVVFSSFPSASDVNKKIFDEFTKEYGIKVQEVDATSDFSAKYQTELAAGKVSTDIRSSGASECASLQSGGFTQDFGTLPIQSEPASTWLADPFQFTKDGHLGVLMNQVSGYFIVLNAKDYPAGTGPQSYKDLADPKYKGKILLDKPGPVGFGTVWASTAWAAPGYGPDYVKAVLANTKAVSTNSTDELNQVANGSYGILVHAISSGVASLAAISNSPIRLVTPSDGMMVSIGAVCMMKSAPHPNAAKVFLNYLDGPAAQKFYGDAPGGSFIRAGITAADPELAPFAAAGAKFFPGSPLPYDAYAGSNPFYFTYGKMAGDLLSQYGLS